MKAVVCLDDGDLDGLDAATGRLIAVCLDNDFALWLAGGRIMRGAFLALCGDTRPGLALVTQGLQAWHDMGTAVTLPHALAVAALGA